MSELREQRWSVMSERGREAARLSYADAAALVRNLTGDKVHGLCVVTDEAAARLAAQTLSPNGDTTRAAKKGGARRKGTKPPQKSEL